MPSSRRIELTEEEDIQLREIEQDPYLKPKVRLRAQVLRLSHRGSSMSAIASYTGRSPQSVGRDLDRWAQRGVWGLSDGSQPGRAPRVTEPMRAFMEGRLTEERTWNATQLAEAVEESFGITVTPEAVRQHLLSMGHSWKRTRYAPAKEPNEEEEEREAREELEELKKGSPRAGWR